MENPYRAPKPEVSDHDNEGSRESALAISCGVIVVVYLLGDALYLLIEKQSQQLFGNMLMGEMAAVGLWAGIAKVRWHRRVLGFGGFLLAFALVFTLASVSIAEMLEDVSLRMAVLVTPAFAVVAPTLARPFVDIGRIVRREPSRTPQAVNDVLTAILLSIMVFIAGTPYGLSGVSTPITLFVFLSFLFLLCGATAIAWAWACLGERNVTRRIVLTAIFQVTVFAALMKCFGDRTDLSDYGLIASSIIVCSLLVVRSSGVRMRFTWNRPCGVIEVIDSK